ncbi:MAG: DNA/RNA non-specific endonuclease [Cellulophaga sp.]|nr:DNA/RNA non-specific endonuclease [Cellulophaga sp.]
MNKKTTYTLLMLVCVVGFWLFENFYTPDTYSDPNHKNTENTPYQDFYPTSTTGDIVHHTNFSLSYHEKHEQAEWVFYQLTKDQLTYDDRKRPYFIEDPKVSTKSADWKNYRGSGYDRGHLVPAGDRRFSEFAYNETFYTSNISPQNSEFNAGVWNDLEKQVRYWCKKYGPLYIMTGGVLDNNLSSIGDEDVSVPNYFYKIVARKEGDTLKMIAFLFPNKPSTAPVKSFLVSVDEIEQKTNINFFEKLPDTQENNLESKIESTDWKF